MRVVNVILGALTLGGVAAVTAVGCGSSTTTPTTTSSGTASTSAATSTSSGSACPALAGTPGTAGSPHPCSPGPTCKAPDLTCIGLVDNSAQSKFGLRMSYLQVSTPPKLASGLVAGVIAGAVQPDLAACNLMGTATFNWLLQFDTTAGTLKTGGAKPVSCPTAGYSFDDEMLSGVQIAPITLNAKPDTTGAFSSATGQDVVIPIYLEADASSYVLLPLKQARITMGTLSTNHNCIGTYNAAALMTSNECVPANTGDPPLFVTGASLDGYITLEDADTVVITTLKQSLCFLLSGAATGPTNSAGITVCPRDSMNKISYQPTAAEGGWCSTTNMAATSTCADSVELAATFAASSVKINN